MENERIPNELDQTDVLDQLPNGVYEYPELYYEREQRES